MNEYLSKFPEKPTHYLFKDLQGQRVGRLTVVAFAGLRPGLRSPKNSWICRCDCGKWRVCDSQALVREYTVSCGCWRVAARMKHGHAASKLYNVWSSMKTRCSRSTDPGYKNYGGRGITVCDRWLESFENFLADMGEPPTPKHSLERVDNDSGYSKENCKWATRAEQLRNKRTNRWISYRGRTMCLEDWAREVGITNHGLAGRIDKSGWSIERALTTPPKRRTVTT